MLFIIGLRFNCPGRDEICIGRWIAALQSNLMALARIRSYELQDCRWGVMCSRDLTDRHKSLNPEGSCGTETLHLHDCFFFQIYNFSWVTISERAIWLLPQNIYMLDVTQPTHRPSFVGLSPSWPLGARGSLPYRIQHPRESETTPAAPPSTAAAGPSCDVQSRV